MTDTADKPWVLLRRKKRPERFATREAAARFYDALRCNSHAAAEDAALFGPQGEAWYCTRWRWAQWVRDDDRRKREPQDAESAP